MKRAVLCFLGGTVLTGCGPELVAAVVLAPIAAPILAIDYVSSRPRADQPLKVVGASGAILAEPLDRATTPKSVVRVSASALTCSGRTRIKCNSGGTGTVSIAAFDQANLTELVADVKLSGSDTVHCKGAFSTTGDTAGPFGVACTYSRHEWADFNKVDTVLVTNPVKGGAAVVEQTSSGGQQVTLWIPPST